VGSAGRKRTAQVTTRPQESTSEDNQQEPKTKKKKVAGTAAINSTSVVGGEYIV
jgi:hypothetical protein